MSAVPACTRSQGVSPSLSWLVAAQRKMELRKPKKNSPILHPQAKDRNQPNRSWSWLLQLLQQYCLHWDQDSCQDPEHNDWSWRKTDPVHQELLRRDKLAVFINLFISDKAQYKSFEICSIFHLPIYLSRF